MLPRSSPSDVEFREAEGQQAVELEGSRTGGKASHHALPQPRQTDTHGAADAAEQDALPYQGCNHGALRIRQATGVGRRHTLALAGLPLLMLFAMAGMALVLVPLCTTRRARVSDAHGFRWPP